MTPSQMPGTGSPVADRTKICIYIALATLTWIVFGQTLRHDFVAYDDQTYVYENPRVAAGITREGFIAAFTQSHARNWHPLTTLSHMLDCQLFGLDPAGHHLVNVLWHAGTVLLLFSVLHGMTGRIWQSAFVAAIFAIHPLRAESVAWIAERKDVLSGFFFMLTLAAYTHHVRRPSAARYLSVAFIFGLGLMCKPMLVTLPLLLLLLDYWPLRRKTRTTMLIGEKLPLLFMSVASSAVTLFVQRSTVYYTNHATILERLAHAVVGYVVYIGQMFWPTNLGVFYPQTSSTSSGTVLALSVLFLLGTTLLAILLRGRAPYVIVGWSWYLICLLPVIGFVQVGLQSHADRYTYLPQIGLSILLTWAAADLSYNFAKRREILIACAAIIIATLTLLGWQQTASWRNTESLWTHAVTVTPHNPLAHYNMASLLMARGRIDNAIAHYESALSDETPDRAANAGLSFAIVHNGLGNALARKGRIDDALSQFRAAIRLQPDLADAHSNAAAMLMQRRDLCGAIDEYHCALVIPPEDANSHARLAALFFSAQCRELALLHYQRALQLDRDAFAVQSTFAATLLSIRNAQFVDRSRAALPAER